MKRTPLKRRTPLRSRGKGSYAKRPRDVPHMKIVKRLPCLVNPRLVGAHFKAMIELRRKLWLCQNCNHDNCGACHECTDGHEKFKSIMISLEYNLSPCYGRVEADHAGDKREVGAFRRTNDDTCISLCKKHHGDRTDITGVFSGFNAEMMRLFCNWAVIYTQHQVAEVQRISSAMETN